MPELPEVETVRRGLQPALEGRVIGKATAFRPDLRFPLPANFAENITGKRVISVDRRAKYLLIRLEGGLVMLSHLGMSGRYRIYNDTPPALEPHDHLELMTDKGVVIRYNDPRRFGILDLFAEDQVATHKLLASLGPEPLSNAFDGKTLAENLGEKRSAIKVAILDQRVVSGVGNIYASEALYRAGISPRRTARTVKGGRAEKLATAIRDVLNDAIAAGGSSLRDHRQTSGELGYFQHSFKVYGRGGEICSNEGCGQTIRHFVQGGRSTFYCAKCQR
jgi:formamidopyrimidine-DNA glycosylase